MLNLPWDAPCLRLVQNIEKKQYSWNLHGDVFHKLFFSSKIWFFPQRQGICDKIYSFFILRSRFRQTFSQKENADLKMD